jgi:hypothetical protein
MKLNFKSIFLIDAVGAFFSAGMIGLVLTRIDSLIGLPIQSLLFLASIPIVFASYSLFCFLVVQPARGFLAVIMIANLLYCALTASILVIRFDEVTNWGVVYFASEILIILVLVAVELSVFRKMCSSNELNAHGAFGPTS